MIENGIAPEREDASFIRFAESEADVERICEFCSCQENSPDVLLLSGYSTGNSLLLVRRGFLEEGQSLACPGLPLDGAAFDPDWGFARAQVEMRRDGSSQFRLPPGRFETLMEGDAWGYRMSPVENNDLPGILRQLKHIRASLARPRERIHNVTGVDVMAVGL